MLLIGLVPTRWLRRMRRTGPQTLAGASRMNSNQGAWKPDNQKKAASIRQFVVLPKLSGFIDENRA